MSGQQMTYRLAFGDGLANLMTGQGTGTDKRMHAQWTERYWDQYSIEAAYRGSWLMRKIVDLPAQDAVRAWRDWQAPNEQIEKLEEEEERLRARVAIREGLIYGRLGGGVVVMGLDPATCGAPDTPLPDNIPQGALRYLRAYSRHRFRLGPINNDPMSDSFGEPEFMFIKSIDGQQEAAIHRSRLCIFKGRFAGHVDPGAATRTSTSPYWGESIIAAVNDAVQNAISTHDSIASLVDEAKIDVFGIPGMMNMMGDAEQERRLARRLELANVGKSNFRALIRDAAETWEQHEMNFGALPDIGRMFLSIAAGASDIPATRLLGKAPDGMNATGDSDQANYDQTVKDVQETYLAPALNELDRALIPSALGSVPDDVYYEFAPLHVMSDKEAAAVEAQEVQSAKTLSDMGLIPDEALAQATANRLIESGRWPGLEAALKALGDKWWETKPEADIDPATGLPVGTPGAPALPPQPPAPVQPNRAPGSRGPQNGNG